MIESKIMDTFTRAMTNFRGTFGFERKVSRGEYSNSDATTASIHVQFDYAPDATAEEFLAAAREAANYGKAIVFESLGIEAHFSDGGILMELVQDVFPGGTVEHSEVVQRDPRDPQASTGVGTTPPYTNEAVKAERDDDRKKAMRRENAVWAKARYETHPQEFYDNRATNAEKGWNSPDFMHKKHRVGFYAD